eukprot:366270-Chlamydomonas_euryale.AAC.7
MRPHAHHAASCVQSLRRLVGQQGHESIQRQSRPQCAYHNMWYAKPARGLRTRLAMLVNPLSAARHKVQHGPKCSMLCLGRETLNPKLRTLSLVPQALNS